MKTIMNKLKAMILIACIIILSLDGFGGKPQANLQRQEAAGFSIGAKGYIGTGVSNNTKAPYWKDFWEYDPSTDSWTQKADFGGTARATAVGFSIGSLGYIGTGSDASGRLKDFWQYTPITNKWTQKANFGGVARAWATGFSIGSLGYIGTGNGLLGGNFTNLDDFWAYDPVTNSWTEKANFIGVGRYAAAGFSIGSKGYLGTGINYINNTTFTYYKDFYEYDPETDSWTQKADFGGTAGAFGVGFSINNTKGYVVTVYSGHGTAGLQNEFWEFDPTNVETGGSWTKKADFAGPLRDCAVGFSIGTKGYVGTGEIVTLTLVQDFWEYNQLTNAWTQKTDLGGTHQGTLKNIDIEEPGQINPEELTVYPNPSNSTFNFRLQTTSKGSVNIKIYDIMGRLVQEYHSLSPDVILIGENLTPGIYIAVVKQGEYQKNVKITKVN